MYEGRGNVMEEGKVKDAKGWRIGMGWGWEGGGEGGGGKGEKEREKKIKEWNHSYLFNQYKIESDKE